MRSWAPLVAVSRRISMNSDPSLEYKTRLQARRQTLERYRRLDRLVARARLLTGIVFFVCVWLFGWWAVLPVIVFIGLLAYHDKVLARARRTLRSSPHSCKSSTPPLREIGRRFSSRSFCKCTPWKRQNSKLENRDTPSLNRPFKAARLGSKSSKGLD